jgi:hypothetical protein
MTAFNWYNLRETAARARVQCRNASGGTLARGTAVRQHTNASQYTAATAHSHAFLGILPANAADGEWIAPNTEGVVRVKVGETVAPGDYLTPGAGGAMVKATTTQKYHLQATTGGDAGTDPLGFVEARFVSGVMP